MPETTPLIKAALNLRVGVGFDVYEFVLFSSMYLIFMESMIYFTTIQYIRWERSI